MVNQNNTVSAGHEKDAAVSILTELRKARVPMRPDEVEAWALADGWSGKNPERLAKQVSDLNAGKRLRYTNILSPDYMQRLRREVAREA